jgi:hypothetical protein
MLLGPFQRSRCFWELAAAYQRPTSEGIRRDGPALERPEALW